MPTYSSVIAYIIALPLADKKRVREFVVNDHSAIPATDEFANDTRFATGRYCPICGGTHVVRNGHRGEKQCYICRECGKSFTATTGTVVSGSHKDISTWETFVTCMMEGYSIQKAADRCGIHPNTAFHWRHKVLDSVRRMKEDLHLSGIVEADETFLPVSYKGNHKHSTTFVMPRTSHKRGCTSKKRGLSLDKVCVPCAVDRIHNAIAKVGNLAIVRKEGLDLVLGGKIEEGTVFVTDKARAYLGFVKENKLQHIRLKAEGESRKGIYNLQHINSYHSGFKLFLERFKGVSTKYLNNYLAWHNFVNFARESYSEKRNCMLRLIVSAPLGLRCRNISDREPLPVAA